MNSFELPKQVNKTLYVMLGVGRHNRGEINVFDFEICAEAQSVGFEKIVLCKKEVSIDIPQDADILGMHVQALDKKRLKLRDQFTRELNDIDRQIAELMALPAPAFDEDLPYHPYESTEDGDYSSN